MLLESWISKIGPPISKIYLFQVPNSYGADLYVQICYICYRSNWEIIKTNRKNEELNFEWIFSIEFPRLFLEIRRKRGKCKTKQIWKIQQTRFARRVSQTSKFLSKESWRRKICRNYRYLLNTSSPFLFTLTRCLSTVLWFLRHWWEKLTKQPGR